MLGLAPEAAAALLIGLGAALAGGLLVSVRARTAARTRNAHRSAAWTGPLPGASQAVMVITDGGRVAFANERMREWLNLGDRALPGIELLAQQTVPADALIELSASPGQRSFNLLGMPVEGTSFPIPHDGGAAMVVVLSRVDLANPGGSGAGMSATLRVLGELSAVMTADLDVPGAISAILESIEQVIPADIGEITVLNRGENALVPYRLIGPPGKDRSLETPAERYPISIGPSGRLLTGRTPILVARAGRELDASGEGGKPFPVKSYLGTPLVIGEDAIGTLEFAALTDRPYTEQDLETLVLFSHQAAVALRHAQTRADESRRVAELSGLANLAQVAGSLAGQGELYARLVESIRPLLNVQALGFLIHDANAHMLQAALPFAGLPDEYARLYSAPLAPGSDAERIFLERKTIVSDDPAGDPQLEALGLAHLAQPAGLVDTVLVPLTAGGRSLGYLQVANKRDRAAYTAEELRVLSIVAGQSAAIIDNAHLLADSRRRAQQAEALRRIAALASSAATLDEILLFSVNEIARLVGAEKAAIFLLDQESSALNLHPGSVFGAAPDSFSGLLSMRTDDPRFPHTTTASRRKNLFRRGSAELEADPVYKPAVELLGAETAFSVPLIIRDRSVGEILAFSGNTSSFEPVELEIAAAAAGQLAGAIERARQFQIGGEDSVQEMKLRARRVQAALEIVQIVSRQSSRAQIFDEVGEALIDRLGFERAFVAVPAERGAQLIAMAGRMPEQVNPELLLGQRNPLRHTLRSGETILIANMNANGGEVWRGAPLLDRLDVESFICVPVAEPGEGVAAAFLGVRSEPQPKFTEEDREVFELVGRQIAAALRNVDLRERTEERLREVDLLLDFSRQIGSLETSDILRSLAESALQVVGGAQAVMIALWDENSGCLVPATVSGYRDDAAMYGLRFAPGETLPGKVFQDGRIRRIDEVNIAVEYKLPYDLLVRYQQATQGRVPIASLAAPIQSTAAALGVLVLDNFKDPAAFTEADEALIGSLTRQTGLILENAELLAEANQRAVQLGALTDVAKTITSDLQVERITASLLDHLSRIIPFDTGTFWFRDADRLTVRAAQGFEDDEDRVGLTVSVEESRLLSDMVANGRAIHIPDVLSDERFPAPADYARLSWLGIPLIAKGEVVGVIALEKTEQNYYDDEHIQIAATFAGQAAVALENAQLFDRYRNLAEELERRVTERTEELALEHERTETLLGIITELSASLDMDIVLNRTLALINRITGAEHSTIILANPADDSLLRRASQGYTVPVPGGGEPIPNEIDEGLAGWVIRNREPALIPDIRVDDRWIVHGSTDHRSTLAIPLMLGAEALGALMLFHREVGVFTDHHLDLIQAAAKQVSVAVNNAHLYLLIRDQAERLGGMLRSQQIESSRLLAILESVVDGVIVTDSRGRISVFNHAAEKIIGLPAEKALGRSPDDFARLFGPPGQDWLGTVRRWSDDPNSFEPGESFSQEIALDAHRVAAVNLSPVYSPHEFLGTVSIFRDITHLIEVDRLKSEFVATVSHELRTPLTSIKGYVDILLMGATGEVNEQQAAFLHVVHQNTERLNVLVDDLLEISRIEAGKVFLERKPVDLVHLAGDVATDYRLRAQEEKKPMQISVDAGWSPPPAFADPARVRQILDNLVGNSYNYTESDGVIEIVFGPAGDFVEICVRDNGVGIAQKDQGQVFDRFFRGDAPLVTATAGTGLGLSIVRYLVEQHGGAIRIESTGVPGEGSAFYFTVPIYPEEGSGGS